MSSNKVNDYSNIRMDNHQENDIHLKFCNQTLINKERQQNLLAMATFLFKMKCFNLVRQRERYMFQLQLWINDNFYLFSKQATQTAMIQQKQSTRENKMKRMTRRQSTLTAMNLGAHKRAED